jgi:hypothetical protein
VFSFDLYYDARKHKIKKIKNECLVKNIPHTPRVAVKDLGKYLARNLVKARRSEARLSGTGE